MRLRLFLASAGVALAVLLGRLPDARALEVFFEDARVAVTPTPAALSGGGSGSVNLITGDELVESGGSPFVLPQFLIAEVLVCSTSGCDSGSTIIGAGGALTTPGVGPLWMDPLLVQASFTITVPSFSGGGNTLTATVTMTGTGLYAPGLPIPIVSTGGFVAGSAILGRPGTIAGTVSSTALGFSGTFATGDGAFLGEGAGGFVIAP